MTEVSDGAGQHHAAVAQELLDSSLPGHGVQIDYELDVPDGTIVVQPAAASGTTPPVRLNIGGVHTANVTLSMRYRWKSHFEVLELNESRFTLFLVDGPHFRPSLADVVEFVIVECGVDASPSWREAVHGFRNRRRREEAAATTRQFPAETAQTLRSLGWGVQPPVPADVPPQFAVLTAG